MDSQLEAGNFNNDTLSSSKEPRSKDDEAIGV